MNLSDNLFIEDAEHDIGYFRRNDQTKRVLVFPPVNNYRRFLVHQLVQEQFQDLQTFSVGQGLSRRLVVCFKCDFVGIPKVNENTSTTGDCFNWKSLNKMGKKNQSTPNSSPEHNSRRSRPAPVALYRPPAARRSQTESSPPESRSTDTNSASTSRDKNRQKRPDRAVYVPKHRRSVTENEDLPVASESTSAGHNATTKRKAGKKASVRSRDSSDEKTNDRVQSDNSVIVNNLIQKPLTNKSTKESESDERENEGKVTDSITSDAFEHISLSKNYTDDCIKEVRTVEIPEQNVVEPELSVDNYNAEVKVMKDTEIIVIESDESSNSNSAEVKDIKDTEIIVIESDQSSNSNSAEVKDIKDTEIIVIESEESVDSCTAAEVKDIKDLGQNSILEQITISCAADVNILEGCERIVKLGETLHSSKTDVEMSEISKLSAIASEKKEKSVCFDECSKNMPNKTAVLKISKSEKVEKKKEKNVVSVEKQNLTETLRISEPKKVEKQTEKVSKKQPISPTSESKPPEKKKKIESDETKSTNEQKTLNRDECDWDTLFDDDGECLDPSLMDEITASVGEVTIEQAKSTSKSTKKAPVEISNDEFGHVIEIYNFPAELKSQDLAAIFSSFKSRGFELKWVDDTHCLGVFGSAKIAAEVLASEHPFVKTRPLSEATALSKAKARRTSEFLQPYRDRPQTCAALARRLVTKSLGVTLATARQEREQEKIVLREAKEKKRLANKQREEIWEGVIPQKS